MKLTRIIRTPRFKVAALVVLAGAFAVVAIAATMGPRPIWFIGQGNWTQGLPNFINRNGFDAPVGVAIDLSVTPNHVYAADWSNNRVLGFQSASGFINGTGAALFFGEHNPGAINDYLSGTSNATLFHPSGVAVDSNGNVFVADSGANRVVEYNTPFVSGGQPIADEVFGTCGNFNGSSCSPGVSAATLNNPTAVAIDPSNNLWVVDAGNNRIVEYVNPIVNGSHTVATVVLGQLGSFTTSSCNLSASAPTADSLCFVGFESGLVFDSNSNLFVSDSGNNRVLEYLAPAQAGTSPGTPGSAGDTTADALFGQNGSFTTTNFQETNGESSSSLLAPGGLTLDGTGNLYIADEGNQRVLEVASDQLDPPGVASLVLGQCGSFTSTTCPAPPNIQAGLAQTFNFDLTGSSLPALAGGLAFDSNSNLYIADPSNNRVVSLALPLSASVTTFSGRVLGQASLVHNGINLIDADGYSTPWGVALDHSVSPNRIYVADSQNNRVLGYQSVQPILCSDALVPVAADVVFGQPDFVSYYPNQFDSTNSHAPTAQTLSDPTATVVDSSGNLFVADTGNNRVLVFLNPFGLGRADGFTANLVIGQNGSFTTAGCGATPSATTLCGPNGLALDPSGNLYIVDANYNRVVEFSNPSTSPALVKVFGQPNATTMNSCSPSDPTAICAPNGGIAFDTSGKMYVDGAGAGTGIGIYNTPATETSPDVVVPVRAYGIALKNGDMYLSQGQKFPNNPSNSSSLVEFVPPFTNSSVPSVIFGPAFPDAPIILPLSFSYGLGFDSSQFLYFTDSGNNRVVTYQKCTVGTPTPTATSTTGATPSATPTATATSTTATSTPTVTPTAMPTPVPGKLKLSTKSINFGEIAVNTCKTKSVKITNGGKVTSKHTPPPITIGMETGVTSPFSVTQSCAGAELGPKSKTMPAGTCKISVDFCPTATGNYFGMLVINSNLEPSSENTVKLKGSGKVAK